MHSRRCVTCSFSQRGRHVKCNKGCKSQRAFSKGERERERELRYFFPVRSGNESECALELSLSLPFSRKIEWANLNRVISSCSWYSAEENFTQYLPCGSLLHRKRTRARSRCATKVKQAHGEKYTPRSCPNQRPLNYKIMNLIWKIRRASIYIIIHCARDNNHKNIVCARAAPKKV